jgi:hypothetical protein
MGYTPGFEGPHPSQLPVYDENSNLPDSCGHSGLSDRWRGDDTTPPGYVWSCLQKCGGPSSQIFYPDDEDGHNIMGVVFK